MTEGQRFQFHKGTIKTLYIYECFKKYGLFQFHKGTIKTESGKWSNYGGMLFQFHKGTIKTSGRKKFSIQQTYFNSIKVRLKLNSLLSGVQQQNVFQFHKGTIKTQTKCGFVSCR